MRTRVRSRRRCRMISWPAAKGIRWVKPSSATVSPSRTSPATASANGTIFGTRGKLVAVGALRIPRSARGHLHARSGRGGARLSPVASGELTTTFTIADRPVHRLGYGTMQLTGPGVWGPPGDPAGAVAVLRRAAELGVELFDTADSYGPHVAEELLREALHPYDGLTVATKAGLLRTGPRAWVPCGRPEYLRQECAMSLRRLGGERDELF